MIVLLNGAFGIGKTTLARILVQRTPGALLFDPELHGLALQRVARLARRPVDDFQDLRAWRALTILGLRIARRFSPCILVPMAVSNPQYLTELREGIGTFEPDLLHLCLVAPVEVVRARLVARGADLERNAWEFRRAAECCTLHRADIFATHVPADEAPQAVADRILGMYLTRFGAANDSAPIGFPR